MPLSRLDSPFQRTLDSKSGLDVGSSRPDHGLKDRPTHSFFSFFLPLLELFGPRASLLTNKQVIDFQQLADFSTFDSAQSANDAISAHMRATLARTVARIAPMIST